MAGFEVITDWQEAHDFYHRDYSSGKDGSNFVIPCVSLEKDKWGRRNTKRVYYLPYSEGLWVGLCEVQRRIRVLRDKLDGLLESDPGREQIASLQAVALLGGGKTSE